MWRFEHLGDLDSAFVFMEENDDGDGCFNFQEILLLERRFPFIFSPLYEFQTSLMQNTFSLVWWNNFKMQIHTAKIEERERQFNEIKRQQRHEQKLKKRLNNAGEMKVYKKMGFFRYYLLYWQRDWYRQKNHDLKRLEIELDNILEAKLKVKKR